MKKLLALLLVLVTILCLAACKPKDDPGLETDPVDTQPVDPNSLNLADMQIVLPVNATWVEQFAKTELVDHIEMMTGKYLDVVTEGEEAGAAIYIGETDYAKAKNVTFTDNEYKEGWAIQAIDGNLVLRGGEVRGVLYAVYHLLEDAVGFRWWNLWDTYVPEGNPLVPKDYSDSGVPAMEYRAIHIYGTAQTKHPNLVRNRVNSCLDGLSDANGGTDGFGYPAHVHTLSRYFPIRYQDTTNEKKLKWIELINPEHGDFIDTHPEWFAWDADTGTRLATGQMCLTNEGFYQAFETALLGSIALDEEYGGGEHARYYSVTFNDHKGYCECDTCSADVEKRGLSGHLLHFVNRLANAVAEAGYDDVYVETLAYTAYVDPPKDGTVPADNVKIRYANTSVDILHNIDHPNNAGVKSGLEMWAGIIPEGNMYVWDYGSAYGMNGIFPTMYNYGVNFAKYYQEGITGYFNDLAFPVETDFWDMKFWLLTKLTEDPTLAMDEEGNYSQERYDALMNEFIYGYYGDAAGKYIREYLDYMHERVEETDTVVHYSTYIIEGQWLTVEDILKGAEIFDKAYEAAGNDRELLQRVRTASSGFDRVVIENWYKWQKQAEAQGIEFTLDEQEIGGRLVKGLEAAVDERGSVDGKANGLLMRYQKYRGKTYSLPEELSDIDPIHIHDYLARTNTLAISGRHSFREDTDSLVGEALFVQTGSMLPQNRAFYTLSDTKGFGITLHASGGAAGTSFGGLYADDIISDGKYHLYKFEDILIDKEQYKMLSVLFRDTSIQNTIISEDMARLYGQYVDCYLSMKVTGDVTCTDPENYPSYSIDRIIIVEQCQVDRKYYNGDATCLEDGTLTGPCNVCGKTVTVKDHGHPLGHSFTKYVMNADGYQTAYCDNGCGTPDNLTAGGNKIPDEAAAAHSCFYYRTTFDTWGNEGETVYDRESLTNTVAKMVSSKSGWNRLWFQNTEAKGENVAIFIGYSVGYNNKKTNKILIPADQLAANNDGKYHTYKIENVIFVPEEATSIDRMYVFGIPLLFSYDFSYVMHSNVRGKPVDIYLRMKYTGDPTGEDKTQPPVYWLEQMVVVDKEGRLSNISENTATCTESGTQTGKCVTCGSKVTTYASPKGHTPGEWQIVTEPNCKIEGLKITKCTVCGADVSEVIPKTDDHILGDWVVMPNNTRTRLCVVCEVYGETEMLDSNPIVNELNNVHDCFAYEMNFENIKDWAGDGLSMEVGHDPYSVLGESLKIDVKTTGNYQRFYLASGGLNVAVTHVPAEGGKAKTVTATIPLSDLQQNQDGLYHFYKIEDTVLIPGNAGELIHMGFFNSNILRNTKAVQDKFFQQLKGKNADIYVSLRYTGNLVTGEDLVYHIDRVIVVNAEGAWKTMQTTATCTTAGTTSGTCKDCGAKLTITTPVLGHSFTNYVSNNDATCTQDGTKTAKCDRCDVTDTLTDAGTKKPHAFTVYTDNGDGTKTAKCDNCDATDTKTVNGNDIPDEVAAIHECFYFQTTFGTGSEWVNNGEIVADRSALSGEVAKIDVSKFSRKDWFLNGNVGLIITLKGANPVSIPIPADQLAANNDGKYHTYKMEDVVLVPKEATACAKVGIFSGDQLYNNKVYTQTLFENIKGKAVDVYLTMKYTGDISGADTSNYPVYYIDQLTVVDSNGVWDESQTVTTATCTTPGTTNGVCYHCGATLSVASSALGHSFTNYVSDNNATCTQDGTKTAKCDRCDVTDTLPDKGSMKSHTFTAYTDNGNGTKTSKCDYCDVTDTLTAAGNKVPDEVAAMHECFYFRTTFGAKSGWINNGEIVADGSALTGEVAKIDVSKFSRKDWFLNGNVGLIITLKGANPVWISIPADQLTANNDGKYHTYKMEDVVLVPNEATACAKIGFFVGDQMYNNGALTHTLFTNIKGKAVDIYLNMKYTGDISGADTSNYPVYYIDQLIIVASEGIWDENSQLVNTATCTAGGTISGACKKCGETLTVASSALGHTFTNYVSDNNATCTQDGTKTAKCDRCDATDTLIEEGTKSHAFTVYTDNGNGTKTSKCDGCDATVTKTLGGNDRPDEVAAMDASRYFRTTFGTGSEWVNNGEIVADSSSLTGEVAKIDVSKFGRKDWFLNTATRTSLAIIVTLKGANPVVSIPIPADQLAANNDGKYHIYKIEDVVLVPEGATACAKVGLFVGDQLYNNRVFPNTLFNNIKGKTVDVYLNMKYTGDISGADTSNYPVYYIDQLIVAATEG